MKVYHLFICFFFAGFLYCGAQTNADTDLISHVYDKFVFAIYSDGNDYPEDYFTINALKKLEANYEFDCEGGPCYAFYELRTNRQDSRPGTEGESVILSMEPCGDGWYSVSYSDMGWHGMTRIKIVDGKIDDYVPCGLNQHQ